MTDKNDEKIFNIYTKLKLEVNKYDEFKQSDVVRIVIKCMKLVNKIKDMTGQQKKESVIKIVKLLIKEYGKGNFDGYDFNLIHYIIEDLYDEGILKRGCCW